MVDGKVKTKVRKMLLEGASMTKIKTAFPVNADAAIKEILDDISLPSVEDDTKLGIEQLSMLSTSLYKKATTGDEVAINAVIKIMQVRQQMLIAFQAKEGAAESSVEKFRAQREARSRKKSSNLPK